MWLRFLILSLLLSTTIAQAQRLDYLVTNNGDTIFNDEIRLYSLIGKGGWASVAGQKYEYKSIKTIYLKGDYLVPLKVSERKKGENRGFALFQILRLNKAIDVYQNYSEPLHLYIRINSTGQAFYCFEQTDWQSSCTKKQLLPTLQSCEKFNQIFPPKTKWRDKKLLEYIDVYNLHCGAKK